MTNNEKPAKPEPSRPEKTDGRQPEALLKTSDLKDIAVYHASQQLEAMKKPGASDIAVESARTSREELLSTAAVLLSLPEETDLIGAINEKLDRIKQDYPDIDDQIEQNRILERAKEFVANNQKQTHLIEMRPFVEWRQRKDERAAEVRIQEHDDHQKAEAQKRKTETQSAREKVGEIFIEEVLEKGAVAVHTDLPPDYSDSHTRGFDTKMEGKRKGNVNFGPEDLFAVEGQYSSPAALDRIYGGEGVHEAVAFIPLIEGVYETVESPGPRKLFGKSEPKVKRNRTGEQAVKSSDMIEGSSDEPAVEMRYRTFADPDVTNRETAYECTDGRAGNILIVSLVMPASVARELEAAGKEDPSVIRQVVEKAVVHNAGIPEEAWKTGDKATNGRPMRPPYEAWAKAAGGVSKMYFKDPASKQFDQKSVIEFQGRAA